MARSVVPYAERKPLRIDVTGATDVSQPKPGFFRARLASGGVRVGIRIWFGPPSDPITGEELDRSWRWQAEANGDPVEFDRVWPDCTGEAISEADYRAYCARQEWARSNAPDSAWADPRRRRDPLSTSEPTPF